MKNLFAIPRLSLFAAYTILITLVVYLAGFTGAEAHLQFNQDGQDFKGNEGGFYGRQSQEDTSNTGLYSQKSSKMRDDELSQQRNFASYLNDIQRDVPLNMIMKRHSEDFDESDEFDSERENDGYGYDDDEYYHFNYKRNDDGSQKNDKEGIGDMNTNKEKLNGQTYTMQNDKAQKEAKTIEMLNFKEMHPNPDPNHMGVQSNNPYVYQGVGQKKNLTPGQIDTLKISDLKENSALDEKIKGDKEVVGGVLSSQNDPKVAEVKKGAKVMEDKESLTMKDSKIVEGSEKKEKEVGLQDKSSLSSKNLKENVKNTEEKEKIEHDVKSVNLCESAKIIEGMDKISKSKEGETAKITKEDKDNSKFYDRLNSEIISSNDISQLNNRVNLVSGDFKDNLEQQKRSGMEEDEKNSEELNENNRNVNLNEYSDEFRERKDILKESEYGNNYGAINNVDDGYSELNRDFGRNELFGIPVSYEVHNDPREFYQKRELWKEHAKQIPQDANEQILYMPIPNKDGYRLNIPKSELENTEYHKNFMKSLKRYKNSEDQKNIVIPPTDKNPQSDKIPSDRYQKRSKAKRGSLSYGDFDVETIGRDKYRNAHLKVRRNTYTNADIFARESRINSGEDRRKSQLGQQQESQPYDTRHRRKSQKINFDTKTFNQGSPIGKGFSRLNSVKKKKEIKKKFGDKTEGNALRQYPYSQVSRDYLLKFGKLNSDKKFKRKAPLWKRREQSVDDSRDSDTTERNKGAPVGYYSNRVKFGQKVGNRNDEQNTDTAKLNGVSPFSSSYEKSRNPVDKPWADTKNQNLKHDPSKRYDDKEHSSNPLLLVKKDRNGERLAKAFTDVNSKSEVDEELSSDQLAKILSKDSDYVILKKKDKNKFQKLNENQGSLDQTSSLTGYDSRKTTLHADSVKSDKSKLASKHDSGPRSDRGLYIRSYHADEENKKYNSNKLHSSGTKSNLRKTFEKFRDLANLFRDNEQESSDNQRQSSEAKAGGEIVFSEDRMPDPIVISNDVNGKLGGFKSKSVNSISNISNNFKTLDQNKKSDTAKEDDTSSRNMFTSEAKTDNNAESSWEPALKNVFPEAKSINSIQKNGNEIIVLDFNQNQLKPEASKMFGLKQSQPIGSPVPSNSHGSLTMGGFSGSSDSRGGGLDSAEFFVPGMYQPKNPLVSQGDRQVEVILHEGALPTFLQGDNSNNKPEELNRIVPLTKFGMNRQAGAYAILTGTPNEAQITIPIYPYTTFAKNLMDKKPNPMYPKFKSMAKKNSDYLHQNDIANNVNQLMKDFKELSKLYQTHDSRGALGNIYSNDVVLPSNSFTEPSSNSDNKMKFIRNFLQSIMSVDKTGEGAPETGSYQTDNVELDQNAGDTAYEKPDLWTKNNVAYETDPTSKRQGKWTSAVGGKSDSTRYQSNKVGYIPEEVREDVSKLLQSEGFKTANKDKYQDSLWEELSEASDKIQRLRREGADKGELKKKIEDALSCRERRQSETEKKLTSDSKADENKKKLESNVITDESKSKITCDKPAVSFKDDKNTDGKSNVQVEPQMKEGDDKGSHESKRSLTKSDFESPFTGLNPNDQLVNSNCSATKRRKRRHVDRRKRSLNVKNRVSTADIQNEILKNLAEDNYQSVYSSGIRRKLLSIQDDEDADNYNNPKGNDEQLVTGETRLHSMNDPINNGIDPTILTLFDANNSENEKSRARRSLSSAFHSNYKREIDLDESMPNDFQNFLVTSLGGFGSQKREVVKKDEALWEGKESSQDNFNQIVDSSQGGKDSNEDSALEKRDVSKSEKYRHESFRENSNYFNDENDKEISLLKSDESHSRKKSRSQENSKTSEFDENKNPTHIRIQVTNASIKEKKSSKPIMDESENTSTEMENLPKEKEFLDKNKVRVNKAQKIYSLRDPKIANSNSVRLEGENPSDVRHQKVYYNTHPDHRRKAKKYVQESAMKPIKNFMAFDQKAMESLLKKYFTEQSGYGITTQKMPVGSHLPQVETVYNPAQGANKAQLDKYRVSSLKGNSKTSDTSKNSLKSNTPDSFDAESLSSYLQDKSGKVKSEKENMKSYVDVGWKPLAAKSSLSMNSDQDIQTDFRIPKLKTDVAFPPIPTVGGYPSQTFNANNRMKWAQRRINLMNHRPSSGIYSSNALYDALKLKQEMQPFNNIYKDGSLSKTWPTPQLGTQTIPGIPDDKTPSSFNNLPPGEAALNHGYFFNKSPLSQKFKPKDTYGNNMRGSNKQRFYNSIMKFKGSDTDKQLRLAPQRLYTLDNGKDFDYLDALDEDYIDSDDLGKQYSQVDAAASPDLLKKFNRMFAFNPQHLKNSEFEAATSDEELDEDYEENNDDEEDYSLLAGSKSIDPDSRIRPASERIKDSFHLENSRPFYSKPVSYELQGSSFDHAQYLNPNADDLLDKNARYVGLNDVRDDLNPFVGSSSVLRKVNENSNNFGENLMKSLNRYNYDETWKEMKDRDLSRIYGNGFGPNSNLKLNKRKINWRAKSKRNPISEIGNRLFYASKSEVFDAKDLNGGNNQGTQSKTGRSVYYRLPKRNPMNAELRGAENEFEYESEGNGKHFTGNLLNGGKENSDDHDITKLENSNEDSSNDEEDSGTNKRNSENSENVDDVKENLEDDGEIIAEDNILENVIGKYIMRKSVKAGALSRFNGRDEKKLSDDPIRHNLKKRSLEDILSDEHVSKVKVLRKRLSSGHLTENNFRKYHKKNPNKRKSNDLDKNADTEVTSNDIIKEDEAVDVSEENEKENSNSKQVTLSSDETEVKRSALDIFKKITSKDKDTKKSDDLNIRTAGFEPILSSSERGVQSISKEGNKEGYAASSKKSNDLSSKLLSESKDMCAEDKKIEKIDDMTHKTSSSSDGPWRIELKEKDNSKSSLTSGKNSEKKFKSTISMKDRLTPNKTKQDLKTYIVLNKNVNTAKRNSECEEATALNSEKPQDNNFQAKALEDTRPLERDIWKRSLKSSDQVQDTVEDAMKSEDINYISAAATENSVSPTGTSNALDDKNSISEEDLKAQASEDTKHSGFVNVEAKFRHSDEKRKFLSNNGSSNGKSIFPIPNDVNIIGDNMHLNEETSKYLGQQIVDAILAQATSDPRFKKFIAPGLSVRASHTRRRTEDDGKSLHHKDFSDQVQTLMQTVMSDLEKLAEKHVKKRMCNQIDNQSKQFLHFLLDVPIEKITNTRQLKDKTRSIPNILIREETGPGQKSEVSIQEIEAASLKKLPEEMTKSSQLNLSGRSKLSKQNEIEKCAVKKKDVIFLMRKKCLLSQLLKNFQYLKDADLNEEYAVKVRALANELETTNKELAYLDASVCGGCKKKKPPECPCPAPNPPPPPCPPPPCPPPPLPPCPPPCPCPVNKDYGNGFPWDPTEPKKELANESQEEPLGVTPKRAKQPADIYRFEPLAPLDFSVHVPPACRVKVTSNGFELVTTQKKINSETTLSPDLKSIPTDLPPDSASTSTFGTLGSTFEDKLRETTTFNLDALDFHTTPHNYLPDLPITFHFNITPLTIDSIGPLKPPELKLPIDPPGPLASSTDWALENPTKIPGLPILENTEPQLEKILLHTTPIPDVTILPTISPTISPTLLPTISPTLLPNTEHSQNKLKIYNNVKVPYHKQFSYPEHPEGVFFRRNSYGINAIPTDKYDSVSQKTRRGQKLLGKNRRFSRNTKNKWLSLRNFRQDQNMEEGNAERKRKIRELCGWWRPKSHQQSQKTYLSQNRNEDEENEEEDPGMEYLVWASMPSVRRRLNNMEPVIDLDKISWPGLRRRRNLPEGGEKGRRKPGWV